MKLLLSALATLVLSGCAATTYTVGPDLESDRLAWANALFASKPTVIVLTDGTSYDATALRLEADTTTWVDPSTQNLVAIPTSAVLEVERRDRGRMVRRIVSTGTVGGAMGVGAVFAVAGFEAGGCWIFCGATPPTVGERVSGAATWGTAGVLTGAFYGLVSGAIVSVVSSPTERFRVAPAER